MFRAGTPLIAALLCSAQLFSAGMANAAAGTLDRSFDQGGQVTIVFSNTNVITEDAVLEPDGNIVVAALFTETVADANASDTFGVVRLLSTGGLDQNFGTGGTTRIAFTDFINTPNAVALQGDRKIVIAGEARSADGTVSEFALARFNSNGTLDNNFGTGGKVTTNFVGVQTGGGLQSRDRCCCRCPKRPDRRRRLGQRVRQMRHHNRTRALQY
jgi:uncharacterized delta-60 repeat protein